MRDLHDLINAADLHMLVAPIKLVGLTRSKYLRYERLDVPTHYLIRRVVGIPASRPTEYGTERD